MLALAYSEAIDFIVIIADKYSVELPDLPNIKYCFAENKNLDFGGYSHAVNNVLQLDAYDFLFFSIAQ